MFANLQANLVPITPQQLLERPLEPQIAYAIDPIGTVEVGEVDDAVSVDVERCRNGKNAYYINTFIANTALLGVDNEVFDTARAKGFSLYNGEETDYMMPEDARHSLSLGSGGELGSPAIAVRVRIHNGKIALAGIDKVRVRVKPTTYEEFDELAKAKDNPEIDNIMKSSRVIRGLGYYSTERHRLMSHDVVASHMILINNQLAEYPVKNDLPWIYRSHRGNHSTRSGATTYRAHYTYHPRLHQGLGGFKYCHATSPIRRFPDHFNQLQLDAHLDGMETPFSVADAREVSIESNAIMRRMLGMQAAYAA